MIHSTEFPRADDLPAAFGKSHHTPGETLEELIVRAHYLALDLRVAALEPGLVNSAATLLAADFLRYWAVDAGKRQAEQNN